MARSTRRRQLVVWAVLTSALVAQAGGAAAINEEAGFIRQGLADVAATVGELAGQGKLGEPLPLIGHSPSEIVKLDELFGKAVDALPPDFDEQDPTTPTGREAMQSRLEALDTADIGETGVTLVVGCDGACASDETGVTITETAPGSNVIELTVPVRASRSGSDTFDADIGVAQFDGGAITAEVVLETVLAVRVDLNLRTTSPDTAVALSTVDGAPQIELTVSVSGSPSLDAALGFTDVTVDLVGADPTEAFDASFVATADFVDPDADGVITRDEWQATAISDLAQITRSGTVAGTVRLATPFAGVGPVELPFSHTFGAPGATSTATDAAEADDAFSLADAIDLDNLDPLLPFTTVTPEQIIAGFGQTAAAIAGAQQVGDLELPFLKGGLSEVVSVAQPVFDFVNQQAVVCGTAEQTPPTGPLPDVVPAGTKIFCQAFVIHDPTLHTITNVNWQVPTGINATFDAPSTQADKDKTVALAPTKHAVFTMDAEGPFDALATYDLAVATDAPPGTTAKPSRQSKRPARTAQELVVKLNELGGFMDQAELAAVESGAKALHYDTATKALSFRLRKQDDADGRLGYDFGDQLESSSGIIALQAAGGVGAKVVADDVGIDITIGVLLGELTDIAAGQPCADPTIEADANTADCPADEFDRFFVKVRPDHPDLSVQDGSATMDPAPTLTGRLGFLKIDATPSTFTLAKKTSGDPLFTLDVTTPPGGLAVGSASIDDAVRLRELLFRLGDFVAAPAINLRFDGVLTATASVGQPTTTDLGSGTITVAWPEITVGLPTVTVDQTFTETLKGFNIEPNVFGTHTGGASPATAPDPANPSATPAEAVLTDAAASFAPAEVIGKRLDNLTDASFCTVTAATATTLACETGLGGGTVNQWNSGDAYRLQVGDPLAMLWKILEHLDAIVAGIDDLSGAGAGEVYERNLPFVGVSPKQLVRQINDLKRASTELRGGPQPTITCGLENATPPTGDPSQLDIGTDTKDIFCQVHSAKAATAVSWSVIQGGSVAANGSDPATVATPTTAAADQRNATVTIDGSASGGGHILSSKHADGYAIRATFTDSDGEHVVDFPEQSVPPTLQHFEQMIESKLGLPDTAFAIVPTGSGANRRVKLDLTYGLCGYEIASAPSICTAGAKKTPSFAAPLNVDLGGTTGGLVGVGANAAVDVTYAADARLAMSFAVSPALDPKVEPDTGIAVKGRFNAENIDLTANLGPFAMQAGTGAGGPGNGVLKVAADFKLKNNNPSALSVGDYLSGLTATFDAPSNTIECGSIDLNKPHTPQTDDDTAVGGVACGRLSLGFHSGSTASYIDDVAFDIPSLSGDGSFTVNDHIPPQLGDELAARILSWDSLLRALPELLVRLEEGLRAGSGSGPDGGKVPIVGDALDAGADVVGVLNDEVVPLIDDIGTFVDDALADCTQVACDNDPPGCDPAVNDPCEENVTPAADPTDVERVVGDFLWDHLGSGGANLIRKNFAATDPAVRDDVVVTAFCGGSACTDSNSLVDIDDIRITFNLGQAAGTAVDDAPAFDIGFDGVPLRVAGAVEAQAGWNLLVDVGLSQAEGPYLVVADANTPGYSGSLDRPAELFVDAAVQLGAEGDDDICDSEVADPASGDATAQAISTFSASEDRCLAGKLGFVAVNMRDEATEAQRTKATIETSLDVRKKSAPTATTLTKLKLTELVSGDLQPVAALDVDTQVNLRFRTGIGELQEAGFPTVVGTFHLDWGFVKSFGGTVDDTGSGLQPLAIGFDNLYLDMSAFFADYLKPTLDEVRNIVGPFKPVIDTLNAPIPVVSDLAALVGQPPMTMLGLMELVSGNNLTVVKSLAAFASFAVELAADPNFGQGLIALGGTSTTAGAFPLQTGSATNRKKLASNPGPANADSLIDTASAAYEAGQDLLTRPSSHGGSNAAAVAKASDTGLGLTRDNLPGTFGVPGLTFPFMTDSSHVFGFIMGQDIALVRYDVGTLQATAGFSYNFGPFMVGPVPVTAGMGGSATLEGRFALGYDSSGLRKVMSGGSGVYLFDGIFIDDLDANLQDVAEVQLIGDVYARAGITVFVATAGIEGGIRMTVALNLDDQPDPDGKLRIEEVFNRLSNPVCLFDVSGKLEAFLRAFLEINYFVGSEKWDWTILEVTLLEFAGACEPPRPQLAELGGDGTLTLNMGSDTRRTARKVSTGEENEQFVVRPAGGGRYSVEAFGVYQVYGPNAPFAGPAITKVVADGDTGNDAILMEPGNDETNGEANTIPFTAVAQLDGGSGNDVLSGGEAADTLGGGPGNDKIDGRGGNDVINGGADDDQLNGGQGIDTIKGDGGKDRLSGGPDGDVLDGGAGDDILTGGPGTDPGDPSTDPATRDGDDTLTGGPGNDVLEGGFGNDTLHGDETLACDAPGAAGGGDDNLDGGPGTDTLHGGAANDKLFGGPGNDTLCGNSGHDELDGDDPSMEAAGGGGDDLHGGPDNDVLRGRSGRDVLAGDGGHDALFGGPGADHLQGGEGNDDLAGGIGNDVLDGGAGLNILVGDDATIAQADNPATERRATPADQTARVALVSNVGIAGDNVATPFTSCTYVRTIAGSTADTGFADCLTGGPGDDVMFGEGGRDFIKGNAGADYERGGAHDDALHGDAGTDALYGDSGNDTMFGGGDNDDMRGNAGDDYMEGNDHIDTMRGDAGNDRMIGGSSTSGAPDGSDVMSGDAGFDVMAGDNAEIAEGSGTEVNGPTGVPQRDVTLHDVAAGGKTPAAGSGAGDQLDGGPDADRMFGQAGVDTMNGGGGRDLVVGNDGNDVIYGGDAGDLLIGGSSIHTTLKASDDASVVFHAALDGNDEINGDDGDDLIFGDNVDGDFDSLEPGKPVFGPGTAEFGDDTIDGGAGKDVVWGQLGADTIDGGDDEDYLVGDLATVSGDTDGDPLSTWPGGAPQYEVVLVHPLAGGVDTIRGGDADDHLFGGQGGDTMEGGLGDDYVEGNAGQDTMYGLSATHDDGTDQPSDGEELLALTLGATDQDDMIGGSSTAVWPDASSTPGSDTGETEMHGNADHDVMTGDNADIERVRDGAAWASDLVLPVARARTVFLRDRDKTEATTPKLSQVSGGDDMYGNHGADRMYGQGGNDRMKGNANDDYLEGNQGADWVEGNAGEDDLIGGSSFTLDTLTPPGNVKEGDPDEADFLHGGGGVDVIAGDNAVIARSVDRITPDDVYLTTQGRFLDVTTNRWVALLDMDRAVDPAGHFGNDLISGGSELDVVFGQDGNDWIAGGPDDDYLEGNGGVDRVHGDRLPVDPLPDDDLTRQPAYPPASGAFPSAAAELHGDANPDGQDDIIGGSSVAGHRDGQGDATIDLPDPSGPFDPADFHARFGDYLFGDGSDDFVLGDNGTLTRFAPGYEPVTVGYLRHREAKNGERIVREAIRFDVESPAAGSFGDDFIEGNDGDDAAWGQNGDDEIWGGDGDDDLHGELGADRLYGGAGEDAMVGDRGSITNTLITEAERAAGARYEPFVLDSNGPPFLYYQAFTTHRYDRRIDLYTDVVGAVGAARPDVADRALAGAGTTVGGPDVMRGGADHDVLFGGAHDDIMNGDSGGDYLFGGDGGDVIWGGRGNSDPSDPDERSSGDDPDATFDDAYVDYVFGGRGGASGTDTAAFTGGSDILDFNPRDSYVVDAKEGTTASDPPAWHDNVSGYDSRHGEEQEAKTYTKDGITYRKLQHHHGIDWIYGGWHRDVMQANNAGQGPNAGDRLLDWTGAYNLYTHCEPDYGGYNDVRAISPQMLDILERLAYATGAGEDLEAVRTPGTAAFDNLALVYRQDVRHNNGRAYPTTPGHFENVACDADPLTP